MSHKEIGTANPYLVFKRGVWYPSVDLALTGVFAGRDFRIVVSKEQKEIVYQIAESGRMTSPLKWLLMEVKPRGDIWEMYDWLLEFANICSLKTGSMYFSSTPAGPHVHPGSMSANLQDFAVASHWVGLKFSKSDDRVPTLEVTNDKFQELLTRVSSLSPPDRGFIRSAALLLTEAKERLFRGESSGAVTSAVSAVEAMYLRQDINGQFSVTDSRFSVLIGSKGKATRFRQALCRSKGSIEKFHDRLSPSPYEMRSGHLHSGRITLFKGDPTKRKDSDPDVSIVLACQDAVMDLLARF